jgi:hypothetical protein
MTFDIARSPMAGLEPAILSKRLGNDAIVTTAPNL